MSGTFDYNKIKLALIGISVQVHKKKDKIGTWAYHTVDGWYLDISPEHYRTHRCHIKSTNSERFTDTIHFNHRKLTRPSITHVDKVMAEIANCAKAIKYLGHVRRYKEINQIIKTTERVVQQKTPIATTPSTKTSNPSRSRVPLYTNNNSTRQTWSMTQPKTQLPTFSTPAVPREEQSINAKLKQRTKNHISTFHTSASAHNKRSLTQESETPPSSRTRARTQLEII